MTATLPTLSSTRGTPSTDGQANGTMPTKPATRESRVSGVAGGVEPDKHRGLFTIPVTPFTEDGALDVDSLRRVISFCVGGGAHGIVSPVNVSEFTTLNVEERITVYETIASEIERAGARSRVPYVAGVGAATTEDTLRHAQRAMDAGADAVIAMPAFGTVLDEQGCYDFYAALSRVVNVPIYIQNHEPVGSVSELRPGTPMSAELMSRMLREIEHVRYLKEECVNSGEKIVQTLELAGDACWGVMGGKAGRFLLDEYRRGVCGTMPACEVTDVHAQLWNALDAGVHGAARLLLRTLLPLLDFEESIGVAVCKEVLYRRRIIASPFQRLKGTALDRYDHLELDELLVDVAPLFTIKTPVDRP
jgi:dihydrodipicolinate synthase/N-acetylneuraminate lyase